MGKQKKQIADTGLWRRIVREVRDQKSLIPKKGTFQQQDRSGRKKGTNGRRRRVQYHKEIREQGKDHGYQDIT